MPISTLLTNQRFWAVLGTICPRPRWLALGLFLLLGACSPTNEPARLLLPTLTPNAPATAHPPQPTDTVAFEPDAVTVALAPVVEGLQRPLFVTHANDGSGRLFVVEKAGLIQIVTRTLPDERGTVEPVPFLDISDRVTTGGNEQGLLGLAFAPDYGERGFFFVNYSDTNGDTVVARYQRSADQPNRADPDSELIILRIEQPARNHNGGMLLFGPDGHLYIGMGDGGGAGDRYENAQDPASLLGKLLRIDVLSDPDRPYQIPADNPWLTSDWNGADVSNEIWAVGLRNPWRFSFDRATGDLWIGDVGQNQYEEIHFTPATENRGGENYGWPLLEGSHCYRSENCDSSGLELPVAEYAHAGHCSVTGGYVYRGGAWPQLTGVYLYGDYCSGTIWATWPATTGWQQAELLDSDLMISSFGEDEAGELYVTNMSGGELLQVVVTP